MLKELETLASDSKKLEEIGSLIVTEAIRNAASEKMGLKAENPNVVRVIRAGDKVPADLLRDVPMKGSVAENGWQKTWTNLGLWDRTWSDNETDTIFNPGRFTDIRARLRADVVFSPKELKVIRKHKIFER